MICKTCHSSHFQRTARRGAIRQLLGLAGFYPWRCVGCGKTRFSRARRPEEEGGGKSGVRNEVLRWMAPTNADGGETKPPGWAG
jgi:hypothetical protein